MSPIHLALAAPLLAISCLAQTFVVANRGSADISVFRRNGHLARTVALPAAANTPEPMYVVQVGDEVVVGDRANDRVVRFDDRTFAVLGTVDVGDGVFHMWAAAGQLWVNNDVDDTTSVIDTASWNVIQTVPMPADLAAQGYQNHDVFVTADAAFVSMLGGSGSGDWVVRFDTTTFAETHRAEVGRDPHLWHDAWTGRLMINSQGAGEVRVLDGDDLALRQVLPSPGAHGIYVPRWTRTLLVTNLPGGGADGLSAARIGFFGHLRAGDTIDTPFAAPHNIAATAFGHRIFVTHSGAAATKVSIYRLRGWWWNPRLDLVRTVDAGTNPFGIALVR